MDIQEGQQATNAQESRQALGIGTRRQIGGETQVPIEFARQDGNLVIQITPHHDALMTVDPLLQNPARQVKAPVEGVVKAPQQVPGFILANPASRLEGVLDPLKIGPVRDQIGLIEFIHRWICRPRLLL